MEKILTKIGIAALNEMQSIAIKSIEDYKNTLLLSPTGSGKTLGFLLPLLKILENEQKQIQVLILVPTRELTLQIESVWRSLGTGFKINSFYGGHTMEVEMNSLKEAPSILVGTPGRIADHFTRNTIDGKTIKTLILDEFDKSLQMGFQEQMKFIIENLPHIEKQVLVSATKGLSIPSFLNVEPLNTLNFIDADSINENLHLSFVKAGARDKINTLISLLGEISQAPTLIFCNQRDEVEDIAYNLKNKGINCAIFHGKVEQIDREKALIRFRNGSIRYLVTTDLAARGLDIPEIENVIHFQLPDHEQEFTHRNGRTARMHASGKAFIVQDKNDRFPYYIKEAPSEFTLSEISKLPTVEIWTTLYVSGGKKDKINKIDIVGFFLQKGKIDKEALGKIEVQDFATYVAIHSKLVSKFLSNIKDEKMKGKKMKIEIAR